MTKGPERGIDRGREGAKEEGQLEISYVFFTQTVLRIRIISGEGRGRGSLETTTVVVLGECSCHFEASGYSGFRDQVWREVHEQGGSGFFELPMSVNGKVTMYFDRWYTRRRPLRSGRSKDSLRRRVSSCWSA